MGPDELPPGEKPRKQTETRIRYDFDKHNVRPVTTLRAPIPEEVDEIYTSIGSGRLIEQVYSSLRDGGYETLADKFLGEFSDLRGLDSRIECILSYVHLDPSRATKEITPLNGPGLLGGLGEISPGKPSGKKMSLFEKLFPEKRDEHKPIDKKKLNRNLFFGR